MIAAHSSLLPRLAIVGLSLVACADEDEGLPEGEEDDRVSFHEQALPVLTEHCVGCHSADGLGPFRLDDYEEAKAWGPAIVAAVQSRTMPPFAVDNSGACGTYSHARWLQDDEIATLAAWVEDGSVEGEPQAEPPTPPSVAELTGEGIEELSTPQYVPVPQTEPGEELEDYQCFLLDPKLDRDRFIVGFEVAPGNAATVHHVLGFKVDPGALDNGATMQALDDASPDQIGWDCTGAAGDNVFVESVPVTYAPGVGAVEFPANTGIPMGPDDVFVVQVHYNLAKDRGADSTKIRVKYADSVARPAIQALWDPFLFSAVFGSPASLPAGQPSATFDWDADLATATSFGNATANSGAVEIWGLAPHMHKRGRKMTIDLEKNGARGCASQVDRYDFNWQQMYFFEAPIVADFGDTLHVRCDWDTTGDTAPVTPGFGTANEMCLVGIYAVPL